MTLEETSFIAAVYERDIDLLLLEELSVNTAFREWFIKRVTTVDECGTFVGAWHSITHGQFGESDLVLKYITKNGIHAGLLIENKISADAQPEQGERYYKRGDASIAAGEWSGFKTCLVAPQSYFDSPKNRQDYDKQISYEEIAEFLQTCLENTARVDFKIKLLCEAIEQNRRGYQPIVHEGMTQFANEYVKFANKNFPDLHVQLARPRPEGGYWIDFYPEIMAGRGRVIHKLVEGQVAVQFAGYGASLNALEDLYGSALDDALSIEAANKSGALCCNVTKVEPREESFSDRVVEVEEALRRIAKLLEIVKRCGAPPKLS
jgi:hypothetical protein